MRPFAIIGLGCVLYAATALAESWLVQGTMAAMAGAAIAEFGGGKIGVAWNSPQAPPSSAANAQNIARGAALGAAIALFVLGAGAALGQVSRQSHGAPLFFVLLAGALESLLLAVKFEILQRGVLRVLCNRTEPRAFVPAAIVVGALGALGRDWGAVAAAASLAACMALLWQWHGGGLLAIFAHATFRFVLGPLSGSGGVGLSAKGSWVGAGLSSGPLSALALALAAVLIATRLRGRPQPEVH